MDPKYNKIRSEDYTSQEKVTNFKIRCYSTNLHVFNLVLSKIKEQHESKVKIVRLKTKEIKRVILKNPHGKGYAVYVTLKLNIRRALITGKSFKAYKSCRNTLKNLGIYSTNQINN